MHNRETNDPWSIIPTVVDTALLAVSERKQRAKAESESRERKQRAKAETGEERDCLNAIAYYIAKIAHVICFQVRPIVRLYFLSFRRKYEKR